MFYRNSNFYSTSKGNILTANIPRPSTIYQTILAQIRLQQNFWKYFQLCDAGFSDFPYDMQISPSGSLKPEWTWPNTSLFQIFLTTLSPLPFFNNEDGFVGQSCFQTAIEENWSEGRIEKIMTSFSPNNLGTQDRQVYAKPALPVFSALHPLQ